MNILAFEAANFTLSLALMKDDQVVQTYRSRDFYGHDAELLPAIEKMLQDNTLSYRDLDLIATTRGPGSFTGIRVTLATAEGLTLASGIPAVAFNALEWVAETYARQTIEDTPILVALESKRRDAYCQLFDNKGNPLKSPHAVLPGDLNSYIESRNVTSIGSGAYKFIDINLCQHKTFDMPTAVDLAPYAHKKVIEQGVKAFPCEPFYLGFPHVTI